MTALNHGADHQHGTFSGHHHGHDHGVGLRSAFWLTILLLAIKIVGSLLSHSLALWSDAEHSLTDVLAIGLAWFGVIAARRPPTASKTYGFHRVGILTALLNTLLLIGVAVLILYEAIGRIWHPVEVHTTMMILVAALSVVINLIMALGLKGHGGDLNVKSAWLHIVGDTGSSLAVVAAGGAIRLWGAYWTDPVVSGVIAIVIAVTAIGILLDTVNILLEGAPSGISVQRVQQTMAATGGVRGVHHLHVWSLAPGRVALSGHLVLDDISLASGQMISQNVCQRLKAAFGIEHCTLQIETEDGCTDPDQTPESNA